LGTVPVMRIGRIIAVTTGAALAAFGVMRLARARSSEADANDAAPDIDLSTSPSSTNADESRLTPAAR
jgi:hypothetical protein